MHPATSMASSKAAATTLLIFALASSAAAFNITKILDEFPDFSKFNDLLSQTKLADEIDRRQIITVLVLDNAAVSAITSLPADTQKKVLAVHVILGYYDPVKLDGLKDKTALLTTLFQTTGAATNHMGFINYTDSADEQMAFSSAEPSSPVGSQLVRVVAAWPYNISVMQISAAIMPPSIGPPGKGNAAAPPPAKANIASPVPAKANAQTPMKKAAPPAPTEDTEASAPTTDADAQAPSDDVAALADDAPAAGDVPSAASVPASSPPEKNSGALADWPASAGSRVVVGASAGLVGLVMSMLSI